MINKNAMIHETVKRAALLGISQSSIERWQLDQIPMKVYVDYENMRIFSEELTEDEVVLIQDYEKRTNHVVYYVIQDTGLWPDGSRFPRYTFLYVNADEEEWKRIDEEWIPNFGTVPAYVINLDDMDCSEHAEICFRNIGGMIISVS